MILNVKMIHSFDKESVRGSSSEWMDRRLLVGGSSRSGRKTPAAFVPPIITQNARLIIVSLSTMRYYTKYS